MGETKITSQQAAALAKTIAQTAGLELRGCVTIVPNHCCPVVNLSNELIGIRNRDVEVIWQVAVRGAVQ